MPPSPPDLFDMRAREQRRDRAFRSGPVLFAYDRAFCDILERIADARRSFSSALLIGCPNPAWPQLLAALAETVSVVDPAPAFADAAGGQRVVEDKLDLQPGSFDLVVAAGTLDTANKLPEALLRLRLLLKPDGLLIGAIAGGDTLPQLRRAMRDADSVMGAASPHVHPRIEPPALARLLTAAGFEMPVIDVERMRIAYRGFQQLVADLRGMGATNILKARSRVPLTRKALAAAEAAFDADSDEERTTELFELLHFAAWTPANGRNR